MSTSTNGSMSVNLIKLKKAISLNHDILLDALEDYGFKDPRIKGDYIQCGFEEGSSGNSIIIRNNENKIVFFKRYSTGETGDIIDLFLMKEADLATIFNDLKKRFYESYNDVSIDETSFHRKSFVEIIQSNEIHENEYNILDENFIGKQIISLLFMMDKIRPSIQLEFKIWESEEQNRICLNWRDIKGNLVGVIGRYNGKCLYNKYIPIGEGFKKTLHLFGLYENLKYIIRSKIVYIFEAEKSVLQTASNFHRNSVSTGYSNISANQLGLLNYLHIKTLYFCPDEDINIIEHAKILRRTINQNGYNFNNIYYIYDKDKKYMPNGSKMSPADLNKEDYEKFINECKISYLDIIKLIDTEEKNGK